MASNSTLTEVRDRGWLNGLAPLWRKENHGLWGTWAWLVQILIWIAIIDGMMVIVALAESKMATQENNQVISQAEASEVEQGPKATILMVYFIFAGTIPTCAKVISGHETIIDERKMGTAAWVLSKPVSRAAFLLSKLYADALGVLATMILVQGLIAYFSYKAIIGTWLSFPGFLAAMGLIFLFMLFYLALILMLGTLFQSRGPVIGIPLVLISAGYLTALIPWLGKFMPVNLIMSVGEQLSLAEALAVGQPLSTVAPIISTVLLIILFIIIALVRFEREEF
jgi:ABC-2 type transport system permease protein